MTLVEILIVLAIVGTMMALLLSGIGASRESARLLQCAHHLSQITKAALLYESSRRHLPPAILGVPTAYLYEMTPTRYSGAYFQPKSPFFWRRYQYTSSFGLMLPYLELETLSRKADPISFDVNRNLASLVNSYGLQQYYSPLYVPGFGELATERLPFLQCPSDRTTPDAVVPFGLQPVVVGPRDTRIIYQDLRQESPHVDPGVTNYVACGGAHMGGEHTDEELQRYTGAMSSGKKIGLHKITDGTSSTILFGENIGDVRDDKSYIVGRQSWYLGGLARGQGLAKWKSDPPDDVLLGDAKKSAFVGFGAVHSGGVTFGYADSHVELLSRDIDWRVLYSKCGRHDAVESAPRRGS